MFDFEKLDVYHKAKCFNKEVSSFLKTTKSVDSVSKNQLKRASLSIILNIAEGSGRFTKPDRRHFYVIARGSTFECVALFDFLKDEEYLTDDSYLTFYKKADELSRMLFTMVKNLAG